MPISLQVSTLLPCQLTVLSFSLQSCLGAGVESSLFTEVAAQNGVLVSDVFSADASFPDSLHSVLVTLDKLPTRITVLLGTTDDLEQVVMQLKCVERSLFFGKVLSARLNSNNGDAQRLQY